MKRGKTKRPALMMLAWCLLAYESPVLAGFGATAEDRCRDTTLHYLKKRGYAPYNWAATTDSEEGNYVTKGTWSVDADEIKVECTSDKQGKRNTGKYKILDVEILDDGKPGDSAGQK